MIYLILFHLRTWNISFGIVKSFRFCLFAVTKLGHKSMADGYVLPAIQNGYCITFRVGKISHLLNFGILKYMQCDYFQEK